MTETEINLIELMVKDKTKTVKVRIFQNNVDLLPVISLVSSGWGAIICHEIRYVNLNAVHTLECIWNGNVIAHLIIDEPSGKIAEDLKKFVDEVNKQVKDLAYANTWKE